MKEAKLSIELEMLEKEMKLEDNKKDGKDSTAPVSRPPSCLECPVCLEVMKPPTKIIQCKGTGEGAEHFVCEECTKKPGVEICPSCKTPFIVRAKGFERVLHEIYRCE